MVQIMNKSRCRAQRISIGVLVGNDNDLLGFIDTNLWGTWLIWLSAILTVWSMIYYLKKAIPGIRARTK